MALTVGAVATPVDPVSVAAALTIPAAIGYSWWRKAPLCLTLAVAMLATFAFDSLEGFVSRNPLQFWTDLALWRVGPAHSGPWSYITMMFVHANLFHLLFNLLFVIGLGPVFEDRIGALRWGVLFFVGGVFANLAFEAINYLGAGYILLGASGGLSAVFGGFGRLYPRERISMWLLVPLPAMPAIYYVIGFILIQLFLSLFAFGPLTAVAWEAHVAGAAFGFAVAPLVMRIPSSRRRPEKVRDFSALKPLVRGLELDEIYGHLSKETLPEAQQAWLERFASKAACPQCGKPLRWSRGSMRSDCGWSLRL